MNTSIVRKILGYILLFEAALMLLPYLVGVIYSERQRYAFLTVAAISAVCGLLLIIKKAKSTVFYFKEGCVSVAAGWIIMSAFGAFPFMITKEIPNFFDAFFETVSGFTTTGASILTDVEALSHCSLFWRSFTHWIGGMGVLVFIMAILPLGGNSGSTMNFMRAESPGPTVGKFVPKARSTAMFLYIVYFFMTALEVVFLCFGGMSFFDSLLISFGSAGTGGFSVLNTSIASYSNYIKWVIIIFITLFGMNFGTYFLLFKKQFKKVLHLEEIRWYLIIIIVATVIIYINLRTRSVPKFTALTNSAFQVTSIITTTGFSTTDFNLWPEMAKAVLMIIMFIGACAGSTGGGIKVSRLIIIVKNFFNHMRTYIHPKSVKQIRVDGKAVEKDTVTSIYVYLSTVIVVLVTSVLIISFENHDFETNFSAVLTTMSNVGPGFSKVGPTSNFSFYSPLSKLILSFDMLVGRLELIPLLVLFNPQLWKEAAKHRLSYYRRSAKKKKLNKANKTK